MFLREIFLFAFEDLHLPVNRKKTEELNIKIIRINDLFTSGNKSDRFVGILALFSIIAQ